VRRKTPAADNDGYSTFFRKGLTILIADEPDPN
jgi:hypothetical protein